MPWQEVCGREAGREGGGGVGNSRGAAKMSSLAPTSGYRFAADLSKVAATHDISHVGLLCLGYFRSLSRSLFLSLCLLTVRECVCGGLSNMKFIQVTLV